MKYSYFIFPYTNTNTGHSLSVPLKTPAQPVQIVWNGETIAIAQLNRKTDHREHKNGANLHQGFKLSDISNQKQIVADFCYYKR